MPTDTIQIGPIILSKAVFDVLAPLLASLLGALVGSWVTYLATRAIEDRKWKQQKEDKLLEQRREALAQLLEWIDPIYNALLEVNSLVSGFFFRGATEENLVRQWPDLVKILAAKDLPRRLHVLLPPDLYKRGSDIRRGIEALQAYILMMSPQNSKGQLTEDVRKALDQVTALQEQLSAFTEELYKAYRKTYE